MNMYIFKNFKEVKKRLDYVLIRDKFKRNSLNDEIVSCK